jgi:hypothetical protein
VPSPGGEAVVSQDVGEATVDGELVRGVIELVVLKVEIDVGEQFALRDEELTVPGAAYEDVTSLHASSVDPAMCGVAAI